MRRAADPPTIPLDQIKPGMTGVGYTIFAGDQIEKFDLEVLGILPNLIGPRQSIILVQLKGPHVEHTGVVAGMSGSPVYIDGKLAGALSLKFGQFNKEPLAGVTPIQDILSCPPEMPTGARGPLPGANPAAGRKHDRFRMEGPRYPLPDQWARVAGISGGAFLQPIAFAAGALRLYAGRLPAVCRRLGSLRNDGDAGRVGANLRPTIHRSPPAT